MSNDNEKVKKLTEAANEVFRDNRKADQWLNSTHSQVFGQPKTGRCCSGR